MWLRADFAKALLVTGLLLSAVAMGGEQATRYVVDSQPVIEHGTDDGAGPVVKLDATSDCVR